MTKKKMQKQKRIIKSEQKAVVRVKNDNLVCRDCLQRWDDNIIFGNVSKCEFYPQCKPLEVLRGGKCNEYVKE